MAVSCSVGHKGKFGHEFLEFEFRPDGKLRYANKCVCSLCAAGSPASRSIGTSEPDCLPLALCAAARTTRTTR